MPSYVDGEARVDTRPRQPSLARQAGYPAPPAIRANHPQQAATSHPRVGEATGARQSTQRLRPPAGNGAKRSVEWRHAPRQRGRALPPDSEPSWLAGMPWTVHLSVQAPATALLAYSRRVATRLV